MLAKGVGITKARYYPGAEKTFVKLLAEPDTLRLIGGVIHGGEGVKERCDFLAFAAKRGATLYDLAYMENIYSPPIGALFEPIQIAAQNALAAQRARTSWRSRHERAVRRQAQPARALGVAPAPRGAAASWGATSPRRSSRTSPKGGRFWRMLFVPVYRRVPWTREGEAMGALGMTAKGWKAPDAQAGRAVAPAAGRVRRRSQGAGRRVQAGDPGHIGCGAR